MTGRPADDNRTSQVFVLRDGRELGFAEWGVPESDFVVVDFHGGPGCRLETTVDVDRLDGFGVRWITLDRPGLGLSWPHPGRRVGDFVSDVVELLDHLRIERFVATGWSMGCPYAAACAALVPERVRGLAMLAPAPIGLHEIGAADRMGKAWAWQLARDEPWQMVEIYTALGLEARRNAGLAIQLFSDGLSASEAAGMARAEVQRELLDVLVEATRQGAVGLVEDLRVEMRPWGYDPATIVCPGIVWQGDDDSFVTNDDARTWIDAVPHLNLTIWPGEGHLLPLVHSYEVLAALAVLNTDEGHHPGG